MAENPRLQLLQALQGRADSHLVVNEIFLSIQGESTHAGRPCVFVRTGACNLRCSYCDTAYAFHEGAAMHINEVMSQVLAHATPLVELTGGEPLLQPLAPELCRRLLAAGCEVLVETSGSLDISVVPPGARVILDVKTPGSGEEAANDYGNLARLRPGDEVKFVLVSRADYEWARQFVRERALHQRATVLFSPAFRLVSPADLSRWINEDHLPVRLNMQLHKLIWPPHLRGV